MARPRNGRSMSRDCEHLNPNATKVNAFYVSEMAAEFFSCRASVIYPRQELVGILTLGHIRIWGGKFLCFFYPKARNGNSSFSHDDEKKYPLFDHCLFFFFHIVHILISFQRDVKNPPLGISSVNEFTLRLLSINLGPRNRTELCIIVHTGKYVPLRGISSVKKHAQAISFVVIDVKRRSVGNVFLWIRIHKKKIITKRILCIKIFFFFFLFF